MAGWWAESSKERSGPGSYSGRGLRPRPRRDPRAVRLLHRPLRRPRRPAKEQPDGRDHPEGRRRHRLARVLRPARRRRRGRSSPRATPTTRSTGPRASGCSPGCCAARSRTSSSTGGPTAARADLHLPRDDQDRRGEPRQPLPRRLARREVRLPDLGHAGRRQVDQLQPVLRRRLRRRRTGHRRHACTRSRCTSSPTARFEVVISQREHPGNWLRSEADTGAWPSARPSSTSAHQTHAELHIERLDDDGTPPEPLTAEELYLSLIYAGLLREGRRRDRRPVGDPPVPVAERVHRRGRAGRDRQVQGSRRSSGTRRYFDLADDEALVVEVTPPECEYWMIALHNHWMETLDYVHHQATLNCHSAQLEDDGSVRFVDRPPRSRACPTGSTPPATGAAPSACAGSAPTSSTSSPPRGWSSCRRCRECALTSSRQSGRSR